MISVNVSSILIRLVNLFNFIARYLYQYCHILFYYYKRCHILDFIFLQTDFLQKRLYSLCVCISTHRRLNTCSDFYNYFFFIVVRLVLVVVPFKFSYCLKMVSHTYQLSAILPYGSI